MNRKLRITVAERANYTCEYCRISVGFYQVDHIVSKRLGGTDEMENLACACIICNQAKGYLISGLDETGKEVRLFNPRTEHWEDHFQFVGARIEGLTPAGKITVKILKLNAAERMEERPEPT